MTPAFFLKQIQSTRSYLTVHTSRSDFTGKGISALMQLNKDIKKVKMSSEDRKKLHNELNELKKFITSSIDKFKEV